jgi:DMSO/TMAO reductase YedYZ molybdopterin-dependent catalytic subunit
MKTWDLAIRGAVEKPLRFTFEEFRELPRAVRDSDFHCVLGFSRLDNRYEGVLLKDLLGAAGIRPQAKFVQFSDGQSYDTTIPLEWALRHDVILADMHDGRPLAPEHGAPVRSIVPGKLAWKSCKWVRSVELLEKDKPGFWESRGYSSEADPFKPEDYHIHKPGGIPRMRA